MQPDSEASRQLRQGRCPPAVFNVMALVFVLERVISYVFAAVLSDYGLIADVGVKDGLILFREADGVVNAHSCRVRSEGKSC